MKTPSKETQLRNAAAEEGYTVGAVGGSSRYIESYVLEARGGWIGLSMCLRCGAAVLLCEGTANPLSMHDEWHLEIESLHSRQEPRVY